MKSRNSVLLLFAASFLASLSSLVNCSSDPFREYDPVELTGSDVYELYGWDPASIIAFRYEDSDTWTQIPVQIDEMHQQLWEAVNPGDCRIIGRNVAELMYADASTYSGPDEDPMFDYDDELTVMAKDLGQARLAPEQSSFSNFPENVIKDSFVEVGIADPLEEGQIYGFFYLFQAAKAEDGSYLLRPDAGQKRVQYEFRLTTVDENGSNDYLDVYDMHSGPNPEDTWFTSDVYQRHFAENWVTDQMSIMVNGSTGLNMWGVEDFQFTLGDCSRCAASFVQGKTAFIANIDGPLRAIRSWFGANSGTITQRQIKLYEQMESKTTFLRVHPIPGIFDYINFQEGTPLTYYNCKNTQGFTVDGFMSDEELAFDNTYCNWEMVTGASGTYLRVVDAEFESPDLPDVPIEMIVESWYYDNIEPIGQGDKWGEPIFENGWHMCSARSDGQKASWGTMGFKNIDILPGLPNTDPLRVVDVELPEEACGATHYDTVSFLTMTSKQFYLPPDLPVSEAEALSQRANSPLFRKIKC